MDKQTESRIQFEKLCNEFWNWQEHDEITQGEEEPCLRWDGENYTHRVTAALWRMFKASRESLVVELPETHAHLIWIQAGRGPDDYWDDLEISRSEEDKCCDGSDRYEVYAKWQVEELFCSIGIRIKGEEV
ncbi:hypothetical protein [Serratia fonticola]